MAMISASKSVLEFTKPARQTFRQYIAETGVVALVSPLTCYASVAASLWQNFFFVDKYYSASPSASYSVYGEPLEYRNMTVVPVGFFKFDKYFLKPWGASRLEATSFYYVLFIFGLMTPNLMLSMFILRPDQKGKIICSTLFVVLLILTLWVDNHKLVHENAAKGVDNDASYIHDGLTLGEERRGAEQSDELK